MQFHITDEHIKIIESDKYWSYVTEPTPENNPIEDVLLNTFNSLFSSGRKYQIIHEILTEQSLDDIDEEESTLDELFEKYSKLNEEISIVLQITLDLRKLESGLYEYKNNKWNKL